jgi:hypothetical protein
VPKSLAPPKFRAVAYRMTKQVIESVESGPAEQKQLWARIAGGRAARPPSHFMPRCSIVL